MSQSTESTTESNPFTKPGFIIAAALVVALIAAAVVIFLLPKDRQHRPAGPGSRRPAPPRRQQSPADAAGKSVCGLPSSTETALGAAPKSKWELVGKMAAPTDPKTFGPGLTDERRIPVLLRSLANRRPLRGREHVGPGLVRDTATEIKLADKLLVPGPGRDAAMTDTKTQDRPRRKRQPFRFSGFLIKSYTPAEANVDLAFKTDNGALGALSPVACGGWTGTGKSKPADDGATLQRRRPAQ